MSENPITQPIAWLEECGFSTDEAVNIISAVQDNESPERFEEIAQKWILLAGETRKYYFQIIELAAQGMLNVTIDDYETWQFTLSEEGMKVGESLAKGEADLDWIATLDKVGAFATIEELRGVYDSIPPTAKNHPRATWLEGLIIGRTQFQK